LTLSTRSNPRLASSGTALTSLGAVGGPRGVAAGSLRILVEFLSTYNKGNVDQLQGDIAKLEQAQQVSAAAEEKRQTKISQIKAALAEGDRVRQAKLNTQLRADLKQIETLEQSRSKSNRELAASQTVIFDKQAKSLKLSQTEIDNLHQRVPLQQQLALLDERQNQAKEGQHKRLVQIQQANEAITVQQNKQASFAPRLAGLAIGAVGGILGGAVLGVGFQLAQTALQGIGDKIQDILDPSRHAKDAIDALGDSIIKIANSQNLNFFDAAAQKLQEMGVQADAATTKLLAEYAAQKAAADATGDFAKIVDAATNSNADREKAVNELTDSLIKQADAEGTTVTVMERTRGGLLKVADRQFYYNQALEIFNHAADEATAKAQELALAQERAGQAAALAALSQKAFNQALDAAAAKQSAGIDTKEAALGSGESAKTRSLQAALDKLQSGGGGSNTTAIRNLQEQRQILLLQRKLSLQGANINLERYSGKFLLAAIDAKIKALQKEGQAQSRLNQLLDLQYQMSQRIKRQAGETIQDFVERRAQEQRKQLQQRADLERQAQIDSLNNEKDKVQLQVDLAQNAEDQKNAIAQSGASKRQKMLEKELAASKKHDADVLAAKKAALEKERAAFAAKVKEAEDLASDQARQETLAAVAGAKNINQLEALQGRIAGLTRAKATIQALVNAFALPAFIAKPFLDNINAQLNSFNSKEDALYRNMIRAPNADRRFAKGGVMVLNNARSPFGANAKFGEEGDEIGVVLSHKVAAILKDQQSGQQQVGPFYITSSDPRHDKYMLRTVVKEAIAEAVG
jgi:hypothetical protein